MSQADKNAEVAKTAEDETALDGPSSPRGRIHVLKHADTFAVCDAFGDIVGHHASREDALLPEGLFHDDTRVLSHFVLSMDGNQPVLLSSHVSRDNVLLVADLTDAPSAALRGSELHLRRSRVLCDGRMREELRLRNYSSKARALSIGLTFGADFRDLFEVRGMRRPVRGTRLEDKIEAQALSLGYVGRDGRQRTIWIELSMPARIEGRVVSFDLILEPHSERFVMLSIGTARLDAPTDRPGHRAAAAAARVAMRRKMRRGAQIRTSNELFNTWIRRAQADMALLTTDLDTGPYPYAGIPWFSTAFGRDAIITALQVLWLDPDIGRGVLGYLAARQATEISAFNDSEPGKIMHETRKGEMALLGEVPFLAYFGGVDTTPLFVMLAGAYFRRTLDLDLMREIWPAIDRALAWIDIYGDHDKDGFVEYQRGANTGLANQGWKDSHDSVFHAYGEDVEGPIALCEVQGYVFAAKHAAADIAHALGDHQRANQLRAEAERLRARFEEVFWNDDLPGYALALDGAKRPCLVRASNMGHLLYCGIVSPERAAVVADQMMGRNFYTGWGIRTLARTEARYNPMSYHNGSVWPHDTAIIAAGLSRYGMTQHAATLMQDLFEAATSFEDERLPELFCGFQRHVGERPTAYPVACLPQAWASGAIYMMINACLGLTVDAQAHMLKVEQPVLPASIQEIEIRQLRIGRATTAVRFVGSDNQVATSLTGRPSDLTLQILSRSRKARGRPRGTV